MRKYLPDLIFLPPAHPLWAQRIDVNGTIKNVYSKHPLPRLKIQIKDSATTGVNEGDGKVLLSVCPLAVTPASNGGCKQDN